MILFFSVVIIINLIFYLLSDKIAKVLKLYDNPDKIRKFHKAKTPITGGILVLINIIIFYLFSDIESYPVSKVFFSACLLIFCLGIFDDKFKISPNIKLILIFILVLYIIGFSDNLLITKIRLSFLDKIIDLGFLSLFWTILCFVLFINALNMFDGINCQVAIYSIFLSLFFIFNNYQIIFFILMIIGLFTFLVLNIKSKSFFGDGGTYLLSFVFSYFFIKLYNDNKIIFSDQIVLLMIVPGLDLIRLFFTRLYNNKYPFSPDRNHLHHILNKNYNLIWTNFIIQSLIIIPTILSVIFGYVFIFLLITISIYFLIIFKYKKN
jgi:UDP-GlcNAc:undecaprenyl-phosphate GlcNAc-1-phosphate transferase